MLYAFGFERLGVVASDLYFVDPRPLRGQESAEQGARVELRLLERSELRGSIYSAQPIEIARPIWRADLLESVDNPGSLDRAHHHPRFRGWEPGPRAFVEELTADPIGWVGARLADLDGLLADAGVDGAELHDTAAAELRQAVPEIVAAVGTLLDRVRAGELARPAAATADAGVRVGWL